MEPTDIELVQACLRNDRKHQRHLYEQYKVQMFRICLRYGNNRMEAEDMLQDGFITIFKDLNRYSFKGPLGGWMRKVMVNSCLQHIRKNKNKLFVVDIQDVPEQEPPTASEHIPRLQELTQMIQKLPTGYRTVFNLYVIEGYTHKEIAELLTININTSKSQLSKAKKMLRVLLETKMVS